MTSMMDLVSEREKMLSVGVTHCMLLFCLVEEGVNSPRIEIKGKVINCLVIYMPSSLEPAVSGIIFYYNFYL